ncbi:MAG: hypothetical protein LBC48_04570 [Dysgonamonadaceae bacterium]|jgi:hypothetical protein|nr:hypothetical protein [Dysgonamonadaceae bacterium]
MKKVLYLMIFPFLILGTASVNGQVRISGNSEPYPAAVLDLNVDNNGNGTKALTLPRVSLGALTGNDANLGGLTPLKGMLVYNTNATLGEGLYYWATNTWVKLNVGETDPGLTDANNGLTTSSGIVQLGGTLTQATAIATDGKALSITGTGNFSTGDGKVGIGAAPTSTSAKLEVDGAAANTAAYNAGSGTTIDFGKSNLAYTSANAGQFTLTNLKDGAAYTLAVRGTASGTASFTATNTAGSTVSVKIASSVQTVAGKETLYTILVMGTTAYVFVNTGF